MRVLVTGASGFIGSASVRMLQVRGYEAIAAVRRQTNNLPDKVRCCPIADIEASTDWRAALDNIDTVVHAAARAHIVRDVSAEPLKEYRKVNVDGSLRLARQAAEAGVRRLIFISSIKVNGEQTVAGAPFCANSEPAPRDAYGISKLEAEQGLQALAAETGMEVVIIRPPLVYGPGVKANFLSMMRWLDRGIPLPLGAIDNLRSLVALDNLVDLIVTCISHPVAANQVFLASDGEDLSTTELLLRMGMALGKPARLLPIPSTWLERGAALIGRSGFAQRLCGSLQVDIAKTRALLGWSPPVAVSEALAQTARHYLKHTNL